MTKRLKLLNRIIAIFLAAALFMEGAQTGYAAAVSENEVSGNEILENEILENEISAAAEHLVDTSLGYQVYGVETKPYNYTITFRLKTNKYIANVAVLYTTDEAYAESFFPDVTNVTADEINTRQISTGFLSLSSSFQWKEDGTVEYTLEGQCAFEAGTTYYYRLAYYDYNTGNYYFLTLPDQASTGAAAETSAVSVGPAETEEAGYQTARIVWTVDNPNDETVLSQVLFYTQTDTFTDSVYGNQYRDEDGSIAPGKYYADITLNENPVQVRPCVYVYTTDGQGKKRTEISAQETLTVIPGDINEAEVTTGETIGYTSFESTIQITPWYKADERGSGMYIYLFYREKGQDTYACTDSKIQNGCGRVTLSQLSGETEYEYYIQVKSGSYGAAACLKSYGSEEAPLSFATKTSEIYDDSQFPDTVFRNYIKKQIGISENEPITDVKLEQLKRLAFYHNNGEPAVKSIEGIQYIRNLESVSFSDHAITDAGLLSHLPKLKEINLAQNKLKAFPDLSGLTELQNADFTQNELTAAEVTEDKLPSEFLKSNPAWITDTLSRQKRYSKVPGMTEINMKYAELSWEKNIPNTFAINPDTQPPYSAGRLSDTSLHNALNLVNFIRYVAGIPGKVSLNKEYNELAQAGALVNSVNGKMTHYPSRPNGFPEDLYQKGYKGCSGSNIAMGYSNLAYSIINGWMSDDDSSNIGSVGHRRWVLSPGMANTGFGAVNSYSNMYVFGGGGISLSDFVAWPARNMPIELMGGSSYPWSVSLGEDYHIKDVSKIKVTMKDINTGKTWSFNQSGSNFNGNYFAVSGSGYGSMGDCIIFRPNRNEVSYAAGSKFEISISGLIDKAGDPQTIKYSVNFFSLGTGQDISVKLNKTRLRMMPEASFRLTAAILPGDVSDKTITWSSSNENVAVVDQSGNVTAVSVGDAVITAASAYKGKKASCKVFVRNYALDKEQLIFDLAEGETAQTLTAGDGLGEIISDVTWTSSDESVAAVSKDKNSVTVRPTGSGTARIQAQIKDGPALTCHVTVYNNVLRAISLSSHECTLEKGDTKKLKVYFFPNNTTLSKEVTWSSDNPGCVSVDEAGTIMALSTGTAVITAAVGQLEARCSVTVIQTAVPKEENIPSGLFALTNVQTRLADVSLENYEGWSWENGDILLGQFAGIQEKSFIAVYHKEGFSDYRMALRISLASLKGISVKADQTVLGTNQETAVNIVWNMSGSKDILSGYIKEIRWSSNSDAVEIVNADAASSRIVLKAAGTGKAAVTAEVILNNGNIFSAKTSVKSVDGSLAEFGEISAYGLVQTAHENSFETVFEGNMESPECCIYADVTNTAKLSVKSSNKKAVSAGKPRLEGGRYEIPLTLKAAGTAKITLTANDKARTKKEILICVRDAKPNLSDTSLYVNKLKSQGSIFYLYPNEGYAVTECDLTGENANLFEISKPGTDSSLYLKAKDTTQKGKYKLTIRAFVTDQAAAGVNAFELPVTVTVTEQNPKFTIRQSAKANLFYRDLGMPRLTVTSAEKLTKLELTGCDFKLAEIAEAQGREYILFADCEEPLTNSCNKKGNLLLTFDGYKTISVPLTVRTETKKPKLSSDKKTVTFYPDSGINRAVIQIKEGGRSFAPDAAQVTLQKADGCILSKSENNLILEGSGLTGKRTIKAELALSCDNWAQALTLPLTIKTDTGYPALKLEKSTLKLNSDSAFASYDIAETEVMWKNGACFETDVKISVSAVNPKSQSVIHDGIVFEQDGNRILAKVNNKNIAAGTYKFKVNVTDRQGISAPLTVKVVNTEPAGAFKISTKGTIDVLNRKNSFVTVTPSLKALNGTLIDARLSGRFAHLFEAEVTEGQKILIHAKTQDKNGNFIALITKFKYDVKLILTYKNSNGDIIRLTTPEIKLKLKQGKPKVSIKPANISFYNGAENSVRLEAAATLKGAENPEILKLELINFTDVFQYSDGVLSLIHNGAAVKGKTYNLQFKVTFRGQADNEKAVIVKHKIKMK